MNGLAHSQTHKKASPVPVVIEQNAGDGEKINIASQKMGYSKGSSLAKSDDFSPGVKLAHQFINIPLHAGTASPVIQPKLEINTPGDKYEQEADEVANKITSGSMPVPVIQRCACGEDEEKKIQRKVSSPDSAALAEGNISANVTAGAQLSNKITSSQGKGSSMDKSTLSFMSGRFGVDFGKIKIHTDKEAAQMSQELSAKAFTVGNDIYFNERQYSPYTGEGKQLLAHELTHTVQQGKGIRRQPMPKDRFGRPLGFFPTPEQEEYDKGSSDIRDNLFEILRKGYPGTKTNEFLRKQIDIKFKEGTDDHWLAVQLLENGPEVLWPKALLAEWKKRSVKNKWEFAEGSLGTTADNMQITSYYFPGQTDNNALIIGGVHGSELSGTEVVEILIEKLKKGPRPYYTVIIIPSLFPENAAVAKSKPSQIETGENVGRYTKGTESTDHSTDPNRQFPDFNKAYDPKTKQDAKGRQIEPENIMLLELIDRFRPARIAAVHSTHTLSSAGIYADPRADSKGIALGYDTDKELASAMANKANAGGAKIPGNKFDKSDKATNTIYPLDAPAAAAGKKQKRETAKGNSLGGWGTTAICDPAKPAGNRPAMRVLTIEVQTARRSTDVAAADQAKRKTELEALASVLQEIFLGPNQVETDTDPCAMAKTP